MNKNINRKHIWIGSATNWEKRKKKYIRKKKSDFEEQEFETENNLQIQNKN